MEYTTLGRTGLKVSVAGLGCGGFSRLGLGTGKTEANAIAIIRAALDLGVNLFDTAAAYGTETVLGKALKAVPREEVVIATKAPFNVSHPNASAASAVASLDNSLRELATDYIDIYQLHGVAPAAYDHAHDVIAPALIRQKDKGKFRHLAITETAPHDPEHRMLQRAVPDGMWEVAMLGFHMMHQNARDAVFPLTREHRVGTLLMFAVRNIFSRPGQLAATMRELAAAGELPQWRGAPAPDVPDVAGEVMEYVTLGRTGLSVSVAGLGCGGFSRLGLGTGKSKAEAVALVRQALDMGVNLLDTAAMYGTEEVVGEAIKAVPRESVVVATKAWVPHGGGRRAVASLEASLRRLGTDYVD